MESLIQSLIQGVGIITFLWYFIRGLKKEITSLKNTISIQNETLTLMEKRISETKKISKMYKDWLKELPADIDTYKAIMSKLKDETISELEKANKLKDDKLKNLAEKKLKEIDIQEKILGELPKLKDELLTTIRAIFERYDIIDRYRRHDNPFAKGVNMMGARPQLYRELNNFLSSFLLESLASSSKDNIANNQENQQSEYKLETISSKSK